MAKLLLSIGILWGSLVASSAAQAQVPGPYYRGCVVGVNCPGYVPGYYNHIPPRYFWNPYYGWLPPRYQTWAPYNLAPFATAALCRNGAYWCSLSVPLPAGSLCRCYMPGFWFDGVASSY